MKDNTPMDLGKVKAYPLETRKSLVDTGDFGSPWKYGGTFHEWMRRLPGFLAAKDLEEVVKCIVSAVEQARPVILAMGAHAIKVGLNPIIIDLIERKVISGIAMNGAGIIHDSELAMVGSTSEDVAAAIGDGRFGMAEETGSFLNAAINEAAAKEKGLGRSVGEMLSREAFPFNKYSILVRACELDIPVTVHVAIGTDIIHAHPNVDGASVGKASHMDFRIFARMISRLQGGVFINLGSAVILPEVFLKALGLVRNLGHRVADFTTINMDFIKHYRPMTNVVHRPTLEGGKGYNLVGHHEIMFPLLAAAVIEDLGGTV